MLRRMGLPEELSWSQFCPCWGHELWKMRLCSKNPTSLRIHRHLCPHWQIWWCTVSAKVRFKFLIAFPVRSVRVRIWRALCKYWFNIGEVTHTSTQICMVNWHNLNPNLDRLCTNQLIRKLASWIETRQQQFVKSICTQYRWLWSNARNMSAWWNDRLQNIKTSSFIWPCVWPVLGLVHCPLLKVMAIAQDIFQEIVRSLSCENWQVPIFIWISFLPE